MEIAYLCCARFSDVLGMRKDQILEEGIYIKQGKTGKAQIKAWSPRLRAAIKLSQTLVTNQKVVSAYVISKPDGGHYTADGFRTRWSAARAAAREQTGYPLDFTFHDLKAKGISDVEGTLHDKQRISGHKTPGQAARYDRKVEVVPTVDANNLKSLITNNAKTKT
ncbi:hypothetical protein CWE14_08880 [Aliidiomarina soli]|uniref:Tyr recombinase domain-containing protein n=2 Tax=Aliidiomarina soli TaxID=1928574 RepID=A0A432WHV5_9GAMM|nr:hypothetical protein CWE14_08880 [Aliidiomarina soli]